MNERNHNIGLRSLWIEQEKLWSYCLCQIFVKKNKYVKDVILSHSLCQKFFEGIETKDVIVPLFLCEKILRMRRNMLIMFFFTFFVRKHIAVCLSFSLFMLKIITNENKYVNYV